MKNVKYQGNGELMKSMSGLMGSLKQWIQKAGRYTLEESKVLSIRAKEAGHLTALNAKKHRLNREYQDLCAQLGQQVIGLSKSPSTDIIGNPRIQELMGKADHLSAQVKGVDKEIDHYKQDCNQEVDKVQKKAA